MPTILGSSYTDITVPRYRKIIVIICNSGWRKDFESLSKAELLFFAREFIKKLSECANSDNLFDAPIHALWLHFVSSPTFPLFDFTPDQRYAQKSETDIALAPSARLLDAINRGEDEGRVAIITTELDLLTSTLCRFAELCQRVSSPIDLYTITKRGILYTDDDSAGSIHLIPHSHISGLFILK